MSRRLTLGGESKTQYVPRLIFRALWTRLLIKRVRFFSLLIERILWRGLRLLKTEGFFINHQKKKRRNLLKLRPFLQNGAEEGTRTPTWQPTLDPESSASTNSATSAQKRIIKTTNNSFDCQEVFPVLYIWKESSAVESHPNNEKEDEKDECGSDGIDFCRHLFPGKPRSISNFFPLLAFIYRFRGGEFIPGILHRVLPVSQDFKGYGRKGG